MSVPYQTLLHHTVLRLSALEGTQKAALNTSYDTAVLTSTQVKGADWPFNSYRDAILAAEAHFAWAISNVGNHPWRSVLAGVTAALAHEAPLPAADSAAVPIIGEYGAVYDSTDGSPLTEQPLEVIRRVVAETWRVYPLYYFKLDGGRVYHTRTNVAIAVCVFDRGARLTAFNAGGNMLLPDVLEMPISALAISMMTRDGAFAEQASLYAAYAQATLDSIAKGLVDVPGKTIPGPTLEASAA